MDFIISACSDVGIKKSTNQDSLTVKSFQTSQGKMVFAVLCDGMGGLSKGELASAALVTAFTDWAFEELPSLCNNEIDDQVIQTEWESIISTQNERIMNYGKWNGTSLGTTIVAMLITDTRYYVINVGDSRAYEIADSVKQITKDQTLLAREIELGNMSAEQAEHSPQRNVLLQCVGASNQVFPEMFFGYTKTDAVYMLCSDGFRHEITPEEIYDAFEPNQMTDSAAMKTKTQYLIDLNKARFEQDNISVITVRTY